MQDLLDKRVAALIKKNERLVMTIQMSICSRIKYELTFLPAAIKAGCPTTIDFNAVGQRVLAWKDELQHILGHQDEAIIADELWERYKVPDKGSYLLKQDLTVMQRARPG